MTIKNRTLTILWRYFRIVLGGAIYAVGFRKFLYPNSVMTGGLTGVSMILNRLIDVPVGLTALVLNIPLFIMARKVNGRRFFIGSIAGMVSSTVFVDIFAKILPDFTRDILLGTLYGGVIVGFGIGLVLSCGASTGGSDIIASLVRKKASGLNLARLIMGVDFVIIAAFAVVFKNFDSAMYSVVSIFIASKVMDSVLYGFDYSKLAYIISDRYDEISEELMSKLGRGVTLLSGEGGYSGKSKKVVMCAIKRHQIGRLKRIVEGIDEHAFVIITEAREVLGENFARFDDDI